jgi:protein-tyrosine phosphatase
MSFFSSLFGKKQSSALSLGIHTEFHSHLLPGIDDGVKSFEESIHIISSFKKMGVKRIITTPHIMMDYFKNTPEIIYSKLDALKAELQKKNIDIKIEAAAEYYLDEGFMEKLEKEEPLLTFGDKYILFETSYINPSSYFNSAVFAMKSQGYKPILAHPERYPYLYDKTLDKFKELYDTGIYFQINTNSLIGYYDKEAKKFAEKLIDNKMVDFIGSDCHGIRHLEALKKSIGMPYYKKALSLNLLNDQL